jgi:O-antigen/teichoic acid export membrane protein
MGTVGEGNGWVRQVPSLVQNGLYNVGGQTIRGAVALLTIPVLIRFLGVGEYGIWSLAYAVLGLMLVGEAGISVAATVFVSGDLATGDRHEAGGTLTFVLGSGALMSVAVGVFLWLAGPLLVRPLAALGRAGRLEAGRALQVAGLAAAAFILERVLVGIEQAFDRYAAINGLDILQSLFANVGLLVVAYLGGRTVVMMEWQALAWGVFLVAHSYFVFRLVRGRGLGLGWDGTKARKILRFSLATWVSTLGSAAFNQCDRLIVGGLLGAPVLGVYSAITNMTSKINSFSGMAVQPLVPSLSRDPATSAQTEKRVREAAHLNALIGAEIGIFLFVLADLVMRIMVPGASALQDVVGLQIAAIIYALYSANAPGYFILFAAGRARQNAVVTICSAGASLVLIFVGARHFGLLGALAGNAGYLGTLLMVGLGVKRVGVTVRRYFSWVALPLLALVAAFFVGLILQDHFWWRVFFVAVEGVSLALWFFREQEGFVRLGFASRVPQG